MKIEIVQLENIRSHEKSTIPFAKGFNCLVGGVGSGKSSILFAVDFALFGEPLSRSYNYLLRDGADKAQVTVQFVQNGKIYKLSRGLRKRGKGISQDIDQLQLFEDENVVASLNSEAVAEQLETITGFDKELFREIVWVRQEHLKELLDTEPRKRQTRLDELFGLSDYEQAWSTIAGYGKEYEGEKRAYERDPDVVGLEKLDTEYNKTAEEFSRNEIELQETAQRLAKAKKALEEADSELKRLEDLKLQLDEIMRKEAHTMATLKAAEESSALLARKIEAKKGVIAGLNERLKSAGSQVEAYKSEFKTIGISSDQSLEVLRSYVSTFDSQISTLKAQHEAAVKSVWDNQKRLTSLSTENQCPLCLQPLSGDYKSNLMQRIQDENTSQQKTISQLQNDIKQLQQVKDRANAAISGWMGVIPRIEELRTRISEESEALAEFSKELEEKRRIEKEMGAQLESFRVELSRFEVSELEDAKTSRDQAFRQYYQLDSDFDKKGNRKKDLFERLSEIKERIDQAQQKIERMEKIVRAVEIIGAIRDAYRSIQPKLRGEFVKVLRNFVQQVLDSLVGSEGPIMNVAIDENYTPYVTSEAGVEREVANLSGGERTLLAFAYRLGLGQLIMQSRTGHGLTMLLLDEPTESLGREDGSIDRLAQAISRFKAVEQIIAVTHSEAFAERAEHVIRLEKEAGVSRISVER